MGGGGQRDRDVGPCWLAAWLAALVGCIGLAWPGRLCSPLHLPFYSFVFAAACSAAICCIFIVFRCIALRFFRGILLHSPLCAAVFAAVYSVISRPAPLHSPLHSIIIAATFSVAFYAVFRCIHCCVFCCVAWYAASQPQPIQSANTASQYSQPARAHVTVTLPPPRIATIKPSYKKKILVLFLFADCTGYIKTCLSFPKGSLSECLLEEIGQENELVRDPSNRKGPSCNLLCATLGSPAIGRHSFERIGGLGTPCSSKRDS